MPSVWADRIERKGEHRFAAHPHRERRVLDPVEAGFERRHDTLSRARREPRPATISASSQWPPSITVSITLAPLEGVVDRDRRDHEADPDERARNDSGPHGDRTDMGHQPRKQERHDQRRDEREDHRSHGHAAFAVRPHHVRFGPTERRDPLLAEHAVPDGADEPRGDGGCENRDIIDRRHVFPPIRGHCRATASTAGCPLFPPGEHNTPFPAGKGAWRGCSDDRLLEHSARRFAPGAAEVLAMLDRTNQRQYRAELPRQGAARRARHRAGGGGLAARARFHPGLRRHHRRRHARQSGGAGGAKSCACPSIWALALTTIVLFLIFVGFLAAFGTRAADQFSLLAAQLPGAWDETRDWLNSWELGRWLLTLGESAANGASSTILSALPLASGLLGWLANIALILVIGIYLAADAHTYLEGAIRLLPPSQAQARPADHQRRGRRPAEMAAGDDAGHAVPGHADGRRPLPDRGARRVRAGDPVGHFGVRALYRADRRDRPRPSDRALRQSRPSPSGPPWSTSWRSSWRAISPCPCSSAGRCGCRPAISLLAIVAFGLLFGLWGVLLATPLAVVTLRIVRMAYVEDFLEEAPTA